MDWPSSLSEGDTLIVREETPDGRPRFAVHSRGGGYVTYLTYAEAETRAIAEAERAGAHAWYREGRRLQLVVNAGVQKHV